MSFFVGIRSSQKHIWPMSCLSVELAKSPLSSAFVPFPGVQMWSQLDVTIHRPKLTTCDTHCTAMPRPLALSLTHTHTSCGPRLTSFLKRSGSRWVIFQPDQPFFIWGHWHPPDYRKHFNVCVWKCEGKFCEEADMVFYLEQLKSILRQEDKRKRWLEEERVSKPTHLVPNWIADQICQNAQQQIL